MARDKRKKIVIRKAGGPCRFVARLILDEAVVIGGCEYYEAHVLFSNSEHAITLKSGRFSDNRGPTLTWRKAHSGYSYDNLFGGQHTGWDIEQKLKAHLVKLESPGDRYLKDDGSWFELDYVGY